MSTETDKYDVDGEREPRHSALEELARDERRPAVILLSALLLAALFFAFGIMVGRWTVQTNPQTPTSSNSSALTPSPSDAAPSPQLGSATTETQARPLERERRFSLLIENPASREAAQSLVKSLTRAGYKDVRMGKKRPPVLNAPFPVLIGHYTRDEAEAQATRLRATGGPRLKNVIVIEDADGESP